MRDQETKERTMEGDSEKHGAKMKQSEELA